MVRFDETEWAKVTFSVVAIDRECIELQRASEHGVTVYFDAPEDALRRWDVWTGPRGRTRSIARSNSTR